MRLCSSNIVALMPLRQWPLTKLLVGRNRITKNILAQTRKKEACPSKLYTNVQLCPMTYVCLHPLQISKAGSLNCAKQAPGLRHHTPRSQLALAVKSNGTNVPQYQQSPSLCWFACLFFVLWVMDEGF